MLGRCRLHYHVVGFSLRNIKNFKYFRLRLCLTKKAYLCCEGRNGKVHELNADTMNAHFLDKNLKIIKLMKLMQSLFLMELC